LFREKVWKKFLSIKPTILMNDEWVKLASKKKWKNYYLDKRISIKMSD
jgi:hypothetical protein